jgi:peptide/nickel transport system permease protein
MRNFILKRVLLGIFIIFFSALVVYSIIRALPTSYVETIARQRASNPASTKTYQEWLSQLNAVYGLDKPVIPGFIGWVGNAVKGDFGESWQYGMPVTEKFNQVIWYSMIINIVTFIVEIVISIPLGITAATKQYSRADYAITILPWRVFHCPHSFWQRFLNMSSPSSWGGLTSMDLQAATSTR